MTLGTVLGVLFIVIGFVVAIFNADALFGPVAWFVAAIAVALVLGETHVPRRG